MGGATAINSMGEIVVIDGLISLSAFSSWEDVFYDNMKTSAPKIIAMACKPFIPLVTYLKFGSDSRTVKPKKEIEKLGNRPALLIHSKGDSQVSYRNYEAIIEHAPLHVETFIREGDMHLIIENFANPEEDEEYTDKIIQFINKLIASR